VDAAIKCWELIGPVARQPRIHVDNDAAILFESEILILQLLQSSREQPGS
jgi:hypothetical protein